MAQRFRYGILSRFMTCYMHGFLDWSNKYIKNATLQISLAFQMSVLEMLENVHFSQIERFEHT